MLGSPHHAVLPIATVIFPIDYVSVSTSFSLLVNFHQLDSTPGVTGKVGVSVEACCADQICPDWSSLWGIVLLGTGMEKPSLLWAVPPQAGSACVV